MKVGFIGVGNMGGPMCRNIIKRSNHQVTVFDLNASALKACTDIGGTAGKSVAETTKGADIVLTSLPMPKDVEAVALGDNGVLANIDKGQTYIDLSTNAPSMVKKIGAAFTEVDGFGKADMIACKLGNFGTAIGVAGILARKDGYGGAVVAGKGDAILVAVDFWAAILIFKAIRGFGGFGTEVLKVRDMILVGILVGSGFADSFDMFFLFFFMEGPAQSGKGAPAGGSGACANAGGKAKLGKAAAGDPGAGREGKLGRNRLKAVFRGSR